MSVALSRKSLFAVVAALAMALFLALAVYASQAQAQTTEGTEGVCHIPPGNPENAHFIPADDASFPAHEAHGDPVSTPEECEGGATTDATTTDATTTDATTTTTDATTTDISTTGSTTGATGSTTSGATTSVTGGTTVVGDGSIACVQTAVQQNVVGNNSPQGNGNALATGEGDNTIVNNISNESAQAVAQECNITVSQVDTVVSKYLTVSKGKVVKYQYATASATASAYAKAPAAVQYEYSAPAAAQYQYASASAAPAALPDTGGASLIALGAGVLLVAGGLLARKIVR